MCLHYPGAPRFTMNLDEIRRFVLTDLVSTSSTPIFPALSSPEEARIKEHNRSTRTIESLPLRIPIKRWKCFQGEINLIMDGVNGRIICESFRAIRE
jgi:hypothetical protein